jgi:2-polyprenyl-6-methoxyphenol hydroxylase-like FAD-dependent oxidoreductase
MIGQAFIEQHFHRTLCQLGVDDVHWQTEIKSISREEGSIISVIAEMANNSDAITTRKFSSRYLIGADGAHSFVRKYFEIPFAVTALPITWAVLDGEIDSDFPKCPEIIVFQQATADVAWIPREHPIDRFYVRIDRLDFTESDAIQCIKSAMSPYRFDFKTIHWFSHFTGTSVYYYRDYINR